MVRANSIRFIVSVVLCYFFTSTNAVNDKVPLSVTLLDAKSNTYMVQRSINTTADAYGYFYPNMSNSGWNYLDVNMQSNVLNTNDYLVKSKSFGYLEGYLTCQTLYTFWPNFYSAVFGTSKVGSGTLSFLQENYEWLQSMANANAATDDYWFTIQGLLEQINGLYQGYMDGCGSQPTLSTPGNPFATLDQPTLLHFLLINAWGDLYQITLKYREVGNPVRLALAKKYHKKFEEQLKVFERCSSIIKMLPDYSDVVFGHATWDTYESLGPRILKHYAKPLFSQGKPLPEQQYNVWFSSSPALLTSVDDFFVVKGLSNIGVIETTNELYNLKLLDKVTPQSVLSWTRAITSNERATSGADWGQQFSRYQSGTYPNQWMSLDFDLFTPGKPAPEGFLTVFEEMPGIVHVEDQTKALNQDGYWGSYNIPYYEDILQASGQAKLCKASADQCHDTCPRAKLFKQYQSQIQDIEGSKWILAYNSFQNDTASQNDPCNAIACRGDLYPEERDQGAFGALDVKTASVLTARGTLSPQLWARLGPTHDQQPAFCWSHIEDRGYSHQGQPDCFNYDFTVFPPSY